MSPLGKAFLGALAGFILGAVLGAAIMPAALLLLMILGAFLALKLKPDQPSFSSDDAMISPISLLLIATLVIGFEAIVYGSDLVQNSIVTGVDYQTCTAGSGFGAEIGWIACNVANFFTFIINVFLVVFSVIRFFFNALTFNVPDAPFYIRVLVGTFFIGGIGWAIASLLRGTKA